MSASATLATLSGRSDFAAIARDQAESAGARPRLRRRVAAALLRQARGVPATASRSRCQVPGLRQERVNVLQRDLESGYRSSSQIPLITVILSQTLQAVRHTERIIREMLRVGREGIVIPNFGYWRHRLQILAGHMPVSKELLTSGTTPDIHLFTIRDFEAYCRDPRRAHTRTPGNGRSQTGKRAAQSAGSLRSSGSTLGRESSVGLPVLLVARRSTWARAATPLEPAPAGRAAPCGEKTSYPKVSTARPDQPAMTSAAVNDRANSED